jgi:PqqD family protein of HPr-rel-A system
MSDHAPLVVARTDGVVWRVVGADLVVYETASSLFVQLNRTGRLLWEMLVDGPCTVVALTERLTAHFGVEPERAEADVDRFLDELRTAGLVSVP